jgi:hypothetical protein
MRVYIDDPKHLDDLLSSLVDAPWQAKRITERCVDVSVQPPDAREPMVKLVTRLDGWQRSHPRVRLRFG